MWYESINQEVVDSSLPKEILFWRRYYNKVLILGIEELWHIYITAETNK